MKLCEHLDPILKFELNDGNEIQEETSNWTNMNSLITLKKTMNYKGINSTLKLENFVKELENRDTHYLIKGYYCTKCKTAIICPLEDD